MGKCQVKYCDNCTCDGIEIVVITLHNVTLDDGYVLSDIDVEVCPPCKTRIEEAQEKAEAEAKELKNAGTKV